MSDPKPSITAEHVYEARRELIRRLYPELFDPSHRDVAYYGGRGGAKSHAIASAIVIQMASAPLRVVCGRETQNSLAESVKQLIEDKIEYLGYANRFERLVAETRGPGGGLILYKGMRHPDTVKSLEGADIFWGEEAAALSARSLKIIRPTVRKPGSRLFWSWNPEFDTDPIDRMFRGEAGPPPRSFVRKLGWQDNPWFDETELRAEMEHAYAVDTATAEHVWGGAYVVAFEGAYYAADLKRARDEGRIGLVSADPLMQIRAFWDIGGTGNDADACAIWIAQFVGREIRVLDYYEAVGQPLAAHVNWLRENGYGKALCVLPHDGRNHEKIYKITYEGALREAGFEVRTIPNQGAGAALLRVNAARRLWPSIWINEDTTRGGVKALSAYCEKRDDKRQMGLGPNHNWASHAADAFGLMAVAYEEPRGGAMGATAQPAISPYGYIPSINIGNW